MTSTVVAGTEAQAAGELFAAVTGRAPGVVASAPGRVNLIGEHTDYNNGLVLPFAIDARTAVAVGPRTDGVVRLVSTVAPDRPVEIAWDQVQRAGTWTDYLIGTLLELRGPFGVDALVGGFDLAVASTVPLGAGLSSSAALECATGAAVARQLGTDLPGDTLARLAQRAENDFVGVPCGLMDQMASATCRAGAVLFFDVGADTTEHVPFDPAAHGLQVVLIDTRAHHELTDGGYADRRRVCEESAAALGWDSLRDFDDDARDLHQVLADLKVTTGDEHVRRTRHILTENDRVRGTVQALRDGRITDIGDLMVASHLSLRDDFEVSCPELDVAVDAALAAGAAGARMTGGGFGGSVVALVPDAAVTAVTEAATLAFRADGFTPPVIRTVTPAAGSRIDRP